MEVYHLLGDARPPADREFFFVTCLAPWRRVCVWLFPRSLCCRWDSFFSSLSLSACSRGLLRGAVSLPSSRKWSLWSALSWAQVSRSPISSNSREGPGYIPLIVISFGCFIKLTKRLSSLCFTQDPSPPGAGGRKRKGIEMEKESFSHSPEGSKQEGPTLPASLTKPCRRPGPPHRGSQASCFSRAPGPDP